MQKRVIDFSVGLFVLAGIAALVMLAFKVGNLASSTQGEAYSISANFENIGGLTAKAPVRLAGVTIGRVASISVDPDQYNALVIMSIDVQHNNLPLDTSASILTAGLLGANYVGLDPGGEIDYLREGDDIEFTQSAVILEQLIGQLLFNTADGGSEK
jgi:phospholipid/cholesterol/gamma-HCH transport system substrate-binding protein